MAGERAISPLLVFLLQCADAQQVCQRRRADFRHAQHILRIQRFVDGVDRLAVVGVGAYWRALMTRARHAGSNATR